MNSMKPSLVEEDEDGGNGVPDYLGFHENEEFSKATTKKPVRWKLKSWNLVNYALL